MKTSLTSILVLLFVLVACSPAASNTPAPPTSRPEPPAASNTLVPTPLLQPSNLQVDPTPETAAQPAPPVVEPPSTTYTPPAWASLPLTNARTGASFTLADFAGKTVFVEPMATWCTNCRNQIPNAEAARQQLNPEQYVFVGLSVGENVDNATLASYVDGQGWGFIFAVATEELTQGMIDSLGRTVVTPPSTPHFIIKPDGSLSAIATGSHSTEELVAELSAATGG